MDGAAGVGIPRREWLRDLAVLLNSGSAKSPACGCLVASQLTQIIRES